VERDFTGRFPGDTHDPERADLLARGELRIELRALRARVGRVGWMAGWIATGARVRSLTTFAARAWFRLVIRMRAMPNSAN